MTGLGHSPRATPVFELRANLEPAAPARSN